MTREEFNNNSYLVNNNALYNKHTEHISTTEPLYLDGMPGSDNIVHEDREKLRRAFEWIDTLLRILNKGLADLYGPAKLGTMKLNSMYGQCLIMFQGSDVNRWMPIQLNSYIILDSNGDSCLEVIDTDSLPDGYKDIALQVIQEDSLYVDGEIVDMPVLDFSLAKSAAQILWDDESLAELGIISEEDLLKLPILNIPVSELSRHPEFILAERVPHGDTPSTKTLWILRGNDGCIFGQFQDGKLFIEGPSEDKIYIADLQGKIVAFSHYGPEYEPQIKEQYAQFFGEIESVQVLATGHEIDYVVPNWAEYKLLNE